MMRLLRRRPFAIALLALASACQPPRDFTDAAAAYRADDFPRAARGFAAVVQGGDASPGALYNYGTALIAVDSLARAAEVLAKAAERTDPETRYRARFNGGLAQLRIGLAAAEDSAAPALAAALALYKLVLLERPGDVDAKWNYELALRKQDEGGGGGGGGDADASEAPAAPEPRPQPTLAQRQAEQLLGSAEREEREVQSKRQRSNRPEPPPGGKDW